MSETPTQASSISDVERDTGVAKETLRVWERRYGFPQPLRDANGERVYPAEQVQQLRLVKRLLDQGYRPGKILSLPAAELAELGARGTPTTDPGGHNPALGAGMALLKGRKPQELRQYLDQVLLDMGLQRFVLELASPMTTHVGDEWAAGRLAVFEEHLYAEILQGVLRAAIQLAGAPVHASAARPCILLTTVPLERHGLGLLMAEALLTIAGAQCVSLGVQTPLADIVAAARLHGADVVALSFSSAMSPRAVVDNVSELKDRLAPRIQVWAGGMGAWQARRRLEPGCAMDLEAIPVAVARWRGQQESAAA